MASSPTKTRNQRSNHSLEQATAALVLRRFRVVFNAVRSHFQQMERSVGVGGAQVWALSLIRSQPGLGVTDLASAMDIHQSTASNLVRSMLRGGLISTSKGEFDRRSVQIRLTDSGQAILAQVPGPFEGVLPNALLRLPPETLIRLEADLHELIQVLHADESAAQTPLADL